MSNADLARLAFRLPDALDPAPPANGPDRIRIAMELLAVAAQAAETARILSYEARWACADEMLDLVRLAQLHLARVTEELSSILRSRPALEEQKKAG